jgi:phosphatidylinositol dimannoside acyltransferase
MGKWQDRLLSAAFGAGWSLVCRLPESWGRALFEFGADIAWRRQGPGVRVLEGNLVRVLRTSAGDPLTPSEFGAALRALSRAVMRSYARYYLETFRLQTIPDERILSGMHVNMEQLEVTLEHMRGGRGVIYALPHQGDFEQAGRWVILAGAGSFTTIAERLKPEAVFAKFLTFRQGLGMEVLPTTGGPNPFGVVAQRLRAGKLACIVADRDLSDTGIEVDFFGEKALFPAGPAALAVQTGAALMPVSCWFVGEDEWGAHIYDEIPVPAEGDRKQKTAAMTQAMARAFEHGISEHPEDWHMLQKVFVNDLDPERLARSRARTGNGSGNRNGNGPAPVVAVAEPAATLSPEPVTGAEPAPRASDDAPGDASGTPA